MGEVAALRRLSFFFWTLLQRILFSLFYFPEFFCFPMSECGARVTMRTAKCTGTARATLMLMLLCVVVLGPTRAAHAVYPRIRLSHKGKEAVRLAGDAAPT